MFIGAETTSVSAPTVTTFYSLTETLGLIAAELKAESKKETSELTLGRLSDRSVLAGNIGLTPTGCDLPPSLIVASCLRHFVKARS